MAEDVTLSEPLHELNEERAEDRGEEYDREQREREVSEMVDAAPAPEDADRPPEFQDSDESALYDPIEELR